MFLEYPKIQTVYLRDPATKFKTLLEGQWTFPAFGYLAKNEWLFTEKVDGTNIRVMYHGGAVTFGGKTDAAQIPAFLVTRLMEIFSSEKLATAFPDGDACLYGEGYGAKIQNGGGYIPDGCNFILFDVYCGGYWLERRNVEDVAAKLGIDVVPIIGKGTLLEAIERTRMGYVSAVSKNATAAWMAEGIVMRPTTDLMDRNGHRIITKIKHKDFAKC